MYTVIYIGINLLAFCHVCHSQIGYCTHSGVYAVVDCELPSCVCSLTNW